MKTVILALSMLLISLEAGARFAQNVDESEALQNIVLDSAEIAFATTGVHITLDTSLTEIKKHYPGGSVFLKTLFDEAGLRFRARGCTLILGENLAQHVYGQIKAPSNPGGQLVTLSQLLPLINSRVSCP